MYTRRPYGLYVNVYNRDAGPMRLAIFAIFIITPAGRARPLVLHRKHSFYKKKKEKQITRVIIIIIIIIVGRRASIRKYYVNTIETVLPPSITVPRVRIGLLHAGL